MSSERHKESGKGELVDPGLNHCEESRAAVHSFAENYVQISEPGISKNYCATNSGSPEVELRYTVHGSYR
jgi:hypothetical protein